MAWWKKQVSPTSALSDLQAPSAFTNRPTKRQGRHCYLTPPAAQCQIAELRIRSSNRFLRLRTSLIRRFFSCSWGRVSEVSCSVLKIQAGSQMTTAATPTRCAMAHLMEQGRTDRPTTGRRRTAERRRRAEARRANQGGAPSCLGRAAARVGLLQRAPPPKSTEILTQGDDDGRENGRRRTISTKKPGSSVPLVAALYTIRQDSTHLP